MNFSNLKTVKGSTRNSDSKIGVSGNSSTSGASSRSNYDIKYLGNGQFRFSKSFVENAGLEGSNGFNIVSDPNATLATVKELALQIVSKADARYFGVPRTGKNPKTGVIVSETKNSSLITSGVIEAYLINTNAVTKDVKAAFTLSKVVDNGSTYYTFVSTNTPVQMEMELPTTPAPVEVVDEIL
jgi:hypothetical protein